MLEMRSSIYHLLGGFRLDYIVHFQIGSGSRRFRSSKRRMAGTSTFALKIQLCHSSSLMKLPQLGETQPG